MKYLWPCLIVLLAGCTTATADPVVVEDRVLVWGEIQTFPTQPVEKWNWSAADAVLADYDDTAISVAIWPYALWDQATCHAGFPTVVTGYGLHFQAPYPPCDTAAYQTWVQAVVERYGDRVSNWRIIDQSDQQEPPLANFIGSTAEYEALVDLTETAIMQ
ncbi:MAG: hypothetical protein ACD_41C00251G0004 [uncultured bacterium]|nr:MAG: hypothetical protein ACD_41C00251G0004 [uncultured bacterium]